MVANVAELIQLGNCQIESLSYDHLARHLSNVFLGSPPKLIPDLLMYHPVMVVDSEVSAELAQAGIDPGELNLLLQTQDQTDVPATLAASSELLSWVLGLPVETQEQILLPNLRRYDPGPGAYFSTTKTEERNPGLTVGDLELGAQDNTFFIADLPVPDGIDLRDRLPSKAFTTVRLRDNAIRLKQSEASSLSADIVATQGLEAKSNLQEFSLSPALRKAIANSFVGRRLHD